MSTSVDPTPSEAVVTDGEVAGARPVACWSVRECDDWRDPLPEDVAALLAPPMIVSAESFVPTGQRQRPSAAGVGTPVVQLLSSPHDAVPVEFPLDCSPDDAVPVDYSPDDAVPADYSPRHAAPEDSAPRFVAPILARRLRRRRSTHAA